MPLAGLLGVEALAETAEEVRARLTWREDLCTAGGVMHGGALMALADCAGGMCAYLNLPDGDGNRDAEGRVVAHIAQSQAVLLEPGDS